MPKEYPYEEERNIILHCSGEDEVDTDDHTFKGKIDVRVISKNTETIIDKDREYVCPKCGRINGFRVEYV